MPECVDVNVRLMLFFTDTEAAGAAKGVGSYEEKVCAGELDIDLLFAKYFGPDGESMLLLLISYPKYSVIGSE